jgi:hypothetical protein
MTEQSTQQSTQNLYRFYADNINQLQFLHRKLFGERIIITEERVYTQEKGQWLLVPIEANDRILSIVKQVKNNPD